MLKDQWLRSYSAVRAPFTTHGRQDACDSEGSLAHRDATSREY